MKMQLPIGYKDDVINENSISAIINDSLYSSSNRQIKKQNNILLTLRYFGADLPSRLKTSNAFIVFF